MLLSNEFDKEGDVFVIPIVGSKKRKLNERKDETPAPLSVFGTPPSPTPSLEMTTFTPPTTHSKRKATLLKIDEEREKVITKFLEFDRFSDLQFVQYFKGFKLLCRWIMKHYSQVADFTNLDFKAIDTKILADETKENEGEAVVDAAKGDGTTMGRPVDKARMDESHVEEVITAP
nr:hypothetical protein CFP56_49091 [Quercus suber]